MKTTTLRNPGDFQHKFLLAMTFSYEDNLPTLKLFINSKEQARRYGTILRGELLVNHSSDVAPLIPASIAYSAKSKVITITGNLFVAMEQLLIPCRIITDEDGRLLCTEQLNNKAYFLGKMIARSADVSYDEDGELSLPSRAQTASSTSSEAFFKPDELTNLFRLAAEKIKSMPPAEQLRTLSQFEGFLQRAGLNARVEVNPSQEQPTPQRATVLSNG